MPGKVVSHTEWLEARKALLVKEKELTRASDKISAEIRELPMVKIEKDYTFQTADDKTLTLGDLFGPHKQLIVYHYMFGPESTEGCAGCSFLGAHLPDHRYLAAKDTAFCAVSRGPVCKLNEYKEKNGWTFPWYSSGGSDFNYDFHATMDESVTPVEYNFMNKEELAARGLKFNTTGDQPGASVFYKDGDAIYHTYSAYSRGLEKWMTTFVMLDITPQGRQDGPGGPAEYKRPYEMNMAGA